MKILVPVKRVIDYNVRIRVLADKSGVEKNHVKMSVNPFDEIAVEEAVRLRESGAATEIVAVAVGPGKAQENLRTALAMGADRAILVKTDLPIDLGGPEPLAVAKALKVLAERENPRIVLMGKQGIDGDNNQTGQMLAALLGWPQGTFASEMKIDGEEIQVTREIDGGLETLALRLPAVVTTDLRLNTPRYAKLPDIMKAKKKPLEVLEPDSLGVDLAPRLELLEVSEPPARKGGVMVESVDELVDKLRNEARVLPE